MTTCQLHISGMHCKVCVAQVRHTLELVEGIAQATPDLTSETLTLTLRDNLAHLDQNALVELLAPYLAPHGFTLALEPVRANPVPNWKELAIALSAATLFLALVWQIEKLGLINLLTIGQMSLPAAFLLGVVASLSSCMAIVGGLTLSISASYARKGDAAKPLALFHAARLLGFTLFGGVIGLIGKNLALSAQSLLFMNALLAVFMLALGIHLLDLVRWSRLIQPTLPTGLWRYVLRVNPLGHALSPALLGAGTFFMPCGFTQSMQFYALSSGSFTTGALSLLAFALGTFPVLGLFSLTSHRLRDTRYARIFYKTAGLIVIAFALYSLAGLLTVLGVIGS